MIVALSIFLITIGSVAFHFWSPWWWTEVASNWGNMDDTIILTFWITGVVFVAICFFVAYCVWKFSYNKNRRAEYKPEDKKLESRLTWATAIGVANTSAAGVVTSVTITNSGSQYVLTPTITISEPVSTSTGSFIFNEVVTGATSGTTARVKSYDAANNVLEVSIVDGTFTPGETIVGQESGARHSMKTQDKFDTVDPFADNDNIELRADDIIDFSKTNPFGMP